VISHGEGYVRDRRWYCREECHREAILNDYLKRKRDHDEIRSSTYPVTARSFGAALLRSGKITYYQLEEALEAKRRNGGMPLVHYLLQHGLIDRQDILEALGRHHRVPVARVGGRTLGPEITQLVPREIARLSGVVPLLLDRNERKISLLMKDPTDLTAIIAIKQLSGYGVRPFQGDPAEIDRLLARYYPDTDPSEQPDMAPEEELAIAN
jgi:type IV pilus assembly protein PilB